MDFLVGLLIMIPIAVGGMGLAWYLGARYLKAHPELK